MSRPVAYAVGQSGQINRTAVVGHWPPSLEAREEATKAGMVIIPLYAPSIRVERRDEAPEYVTPDDLPSPFMIASGQVTKIEGLLDMGRHVLTGYLLDAASQFRAMRHLKEYDVLADRLFRFFTDGYPVDIQVAFVKAILHEIAPSLLAPPNSLTMDDIPGLRAFIEKSMKKHLTSGVGQ